MPNDTVVRAPYNFAPFSNRILEYKGDIPAHNSVAPVLKTGEIHVTLTAQTPVFISDGEKCADFFRGADGKLQIPGSTICGMVRQNMQILGFGLVRPGADIKDKPSITSTDEIQDFFFLKRTIRPTEKSVYLPPAEHQTAGHPLPAAADFRREAAG